MKFTGVIIFFIVLILFISGKANASSHSNDTIYPFLSYKHFGEEEGLTCKTVYSCIQDNDGFMWFGTDNGVFRYDGRKFKHFTREDGITDNEVFILYQDHSLRIWFLTFNGYLSFWKNGKIYNPDNTAFLKEAYAGGSIRSYFEDKNGTLWFGTERAGFITIKNEVVDNVKEAIDTSMNYTSKHYSSRYVHEDLHGDIWSFRYNKMFKLFEKNFTDSIILPTIFTFNSVCHGKNNSETYYCTPEGVFKIYDRSSFLYITKFSLPESKKIINIFSDKNLLWICTSGNGCYEYNNGKFTKKYLDNFSVTSIVKDRENNLWFCTRENGIYMLLDNHNSMLRYNQFTGLSEGKITSMAFGKNKHLWLGYTNGTVDEISGNIKHSYKLTKATDPAYCRVTSILCDSDITWCGTDIGIYFIKNSKNNFVYLNEYKKEINTSPYSIKQLIYDSENNLYATCFNNILQLYKINQNFYFSYLLDSITRTLSIVEYKKADFIFSGLEGLFEYLPNEKKCFGFKTAIDFSFTRAIDMKMDNDSLLIIATDGTGLYILKNHDVLQHISIAEGLSDNTCKKILIEQNHMYVATNNGVNILIKENNKWTVSEHITTKNGLLSNAVNGVAINDKNIYVGTDGGLSVISKTNTSPEIYIGKINIIEITTNSTTQVSTDHFTFSSDIPRLVIRFAYPVFNPINTTKIKYRLLQDKKSSAEWIISENDEVEFSSFTPGNYIFQLKPDIENISNKNITSLYFEIKPLWWQTNFVRVLFAFIIMAIAIFIVRKVTQKRYERQMIALKQQTALEVERNRIASDMHDDLGADLTYIAILGEMVMQNPALETDTVHNLNRMTDTSKTVIDKMGEIIWALNSSNDSLSNLVSYLHKYSKNFLESKNISCAVIMPQSIPDRKLTAAFRRNIFLIFKEATNNIVKHSGTKKAELEFNIQEDELMIRIKDFGKASSLKEYNSKDGLGLKSMRRRAVENNGELAISFSNEEGTLVEYHSKI